MGTVWTVLGVLGIAMGFGSGSLLALIGLVEFVAWRRQRRWRRLGRSVDDEVAARRVERARRDELAARCELYPSASDWRLRRSPRGGSDTA